MIHLISLALPLTLGVSCKDPYVRNRADSSACITPDQIIQSTAHCLYWRAGTIVFSQSQAGNPPTGDSVFGAITKSWTSWESILEGCGNLTLEEGPRVPDIACSMTTTTNCGGRMVGYDQNSQNNVNLILFRTRSCTGLVPANDSCVSSGDCNNKYDCWNKGSRTIALTTTTYEKNTGRILDADIELNAAPHSDGSPIFVFTTADSPPCPPQLPPPAPPNYNCVGTDVQNTATHEFGHSLGLDHTFWTDPATGQSSTMSPTANVGELDKRVVDSGSRQFICMAYPKGSASRDCVPPDAKSGCSSTPGAPMLIAAAAWLLRRRKTRA